MPFRYRLRGIAAAILGSFTGRNNDLDGYWAIGRLRAFADSQAVQVLRLDLIRGQAEPDGEIPRRVAAAYETALRGKSVQFRIPRERLLAAIIELRFAGDGPRAIPKTTRGEPFSCAIELTDDRGRGVRFEHRGYCAPHDPQREYRSLRV